jgi:uncharacterized membrane protein
MKRRMALTQGGSAPGQRWPERVNRGVIVFVAALLFIVTPLLSGYVFNEHTGPETIVVEPQSHHSIHLGVYGYGGTHYDLTGETEAEVVLLVLDKLNYERFLAGRDYSANDRFELDMYSSCSVGRGGVMWESYLVLVNEGTEQAAVNLSTDCWSWFSLPIAAPMAAIAAVVGYAVERRAVRISGQESSRVLPFIGTAERRKAVLVAAGLIASLAAILFTLSLTGANSSGDLLGAMLLMLVVYFAPLLCTPVAFVLRFRLSDVNGSPDHVVTRLAHRLRESGYLVAESPRKLSVRFSSTSSIRIFFRATPKGTRVSYRAATSPLGLVLLLVIVLSFILSPLALAISLFMLYRSSVFAGDRVRPKLVQPPERITDAQTVDTRTVLIKCLSENRRLSAEAYEATRMKYHAWLIAMAIAFVITYANFGTLVSGTRGFMGDDSELVWRVLASTLVAGASAIIYWVMVARKLGPTLTELRYWTRTLGSAVSREAAGEPPVDDEDSSFELIAESHGKAPEWLRARKKAGIFRRPGYWLIMLYLAYGGVSYCIITVAMLMTGHVNYAAIYGPIAAVLLTVAWYMYRRWTTKQRAEDTAMMIGMTERIRTLKAEMEGYLRSV